MYNPPVYLKTWGSADPDQACPGRRRCFYIMLCAGSKIKGFSLFSFVDLIAYVDFDGTLKHVSEFLTFVWKIRVGCTARSQGKTDRFHHIALGIRNDPFNRILQISILFFKIILITEDNLFFLVIAEKFIQIGAETLQNINQCGDRRRSKIPFQLGNESLRKLTPVCKFFLGKIFRNTELPYLLSDVHK